MAHWDPDGLLDSYVRYYIAHLQQLGFVVVLAAERNLTLGPEDMLGMPDGVTRRDCAGYDFTSWKAAFELLPDLFEAEELLLCNDSVFAPVGQLGSLLAAMKGVACDFWGLTESVQHKPHLPSYFLFLNKRAVASPALRVFFAYVDTNPAPRNAVGYELNFSLWLARHGLVPGAALPFVAHGLSGSLAHYAWQPCLEAGLPLIKRNLLADNPLGQDLRRAPEVMAGLGYPMEIIQRYFERRGLFTGLDFGPQQGGVSVLMVVGAEEDTPTLAASLESLAVQTMPDWELIAACGDETHLALTEFAGRAEFAGRVRIVRLPRDIAPSPDLAALRFVLAHARRETIAFLQPSEPGCVLPSENLQQRLTALGDGAGVVLCAPGVPQGLRDLFPTLLAEDPQLALSGLLLKKNLLHGLDWNIPVGVRPSWWMLGQLCLDGPFACLAFEGDPTAAAPLASGLAGALAAALATRAGRRHNLSSLLRLLRIALIGHASAT